MCKLLWKILQILITIRIISQVFLVKSTTKMLLPTLEISDIHDFRITILPARTFFQEVKETRFPGERVQLVTKPKTCSFSIRNYTYSFTILMKTMGISLLFKLIITVKNAVPLRNFKMREQSENGFSPDLDLDSHGEFNIDSCLLKNFLSLLINFHVKQLSCLFTKLSPEN